ISSETGDQSRRINTLAAGFRGSYHGLRLAHGHDQGGTRMLRANGARLWEERNAAVSLLLSNYASPGSSRCNQEFVGCRSQAFDMGLKAVGVADINGGSQSGLCRRVMAVRHTLATRFPSRQHFRSKNLIFFPLSH